MYKGIFRNFCIEVEEPNLKFGINCNHDEKKLFAERFSSFCKEDQPATLKNTKAIPKKIANSTTQNMEKKSKSAATEEPNQKEKNTISDVND